MASCAAWAHRHIYDEGRAYTEGEYRDWLEEAGFDFLERVVVDDGTSIITAQKPKQGAVHNR